MDLSTRTKITRHSNAVSAGTTAITPSSGIDMAGFDGCLFLILWGAITAGGVQSAEVHSSEDDGFSDAYAALEGTKVTVADDDDNKVTYLDILNPPERYLKCIVNRATQNSAVDGIVAIQYRGRSAPVTQPASVAGGELHHWPIAGTA